jgi:hypothetical protein
VIPFIFLNLLWSGFESSSKVWIILSVCLVIACVVSYFVYTMRNIAVFIGGCFLGTIVGLQIYLLGIYKLEKEGSSVRKSTHG